MRDFSVFARVLSFLIFAVVLNSGLNAVDLKCAPKSCRTGLDAAKPVCSTAGITYPNRCHLELARCRDANVTLLHRDVCRTLAKCKTLATTTTTTSTSTNPVSTGGFRPQCRPDGRYTTAQCHPAVGYCWCVSPDGVPEPYTSVKYVEGGKRPKCSGGGGGGTVASKGTGNGNKKKSTKRRSSKTRANASRNLKTCRSTDKALFNTNLIKIFHTEWLRDSTNNISSTLNSPQQVVRGGGTPPQQLLLQQHNPRETDLLVLEWKFSRTDQNGDGVLDKTEYRDLKRIVRRIVRPKRCAKSFARACDVNKDTRIGRQEWTECLTRDGIDGGVDDSTESADDNSGDEHDEDIGDMVIASPRPPPHGVLNHPYEEETPETRDDDASDCLTDRQTALAETKSSSLYKLYVPECTIDGRYQKIQCYKSTGYCWCVHEDTGKNIPGTSVKDQVPKCDQMTSQVTRPMKGCPEEKKTVFYKELMDYLYKRMVRETDSASITGPKVTSVWKAPRDEQVATWSFVHFDRNKNKLLEKNEWKLFKETMAAVKHLRRCGKKLPRYCDVNKDRQISMTEWLDCLNTSRNATQYSATTISPGNGRTGRNPLTLILKGD